MADMEIVCANCSRAFRISEFADPAQIRCPDCGTPPADGGPRRSDADAKPPLRLKKVEPPPPPSDPQAEANQPPSQAELMREAFGPNRNVSSTRRFGPERRQILLAWLVFAGVAAVVYSLRFGRVLSGFGVDDLLRDYGWTLLALAWLVSLTVAFAESLMQGVICLLVPGYFLYFLLMSDRIYLRATIFGLLPGLGADTWWLLRDTWLKFYADAMAWILSGGA